MEIERQKFFGRVSEDAVDIAFGVDSSFIPMMGICLTSILLNNPSRKFTFHIFLDEIDSRNEEKFSQLCEHFPTAQIILYFISSDLYQEIHIVEKNYTRAIFFRITAAEFLSNTLDELIYMDSDMLCLNSMDEIFELSLEDYFLVACADRGEWLPIHKKNLHLPDDYLYFNTGFLGLNLNFWREKKIHQQILNEIFSNEFSFVDQDALNCIVAKNNFPVQYISDRYNHFFRVDGLEIPLRDDVVIEHFAGQIKPWHPWCESPIRKIYEYYQQRSPWNDFVYFPRNYQENRLMGRVCRRAGNWIEGLRWYYRYLKQRRIEKRSTRG